MNYDELNDNAKSFINDLRESAELNSIDLEIHDHYGCMFVKDRDSGQIICAIDSDLSIVKIK